MSTGVFVTDVSNIVLDNTADPGAVSNISAWGVGPWQTFRLGVDQKLAKFEWKGIGKYMMADGSTSTGNFKMRLYIPNSDGPRPYNNYTGIGQISGAGFRTDYFLESETFTVPSSATVRNDYVWDIAASAVGNQTALDILTNNATIGSTFCVLLVPVHDASYTGDLYSISGWISKNTANTTYDGDLDYDGDLESVLQTNNAYLFQTYYELPTSNLQTIAASGTNFTRTDWVNAGEPAHFNLGSGWTSIASAGQSSGETFTGSDNIGYIGIPTTVTSIGTYAFAGVTDLQSIKFNGGIKIATIPDSMCEGCTSLSTIKFDTATTDLKNINAKAFYGCTNLNNVVIPASVEVIRNEVFTNCSSLQSITIATDSATGSNLEVIGGSAFKGSGIISFTVPGKVTAIGVEAFRDCSNLSTFTIEQSENWGYGLKFVNSIDLSTPFPAYESSDLSNDIFSRVVDNGSGPSTVRGTNVTFNMTFGQIINGTNYISTSNFMNAGNNNFYNTGTGSVLNLSAMVNHVLISNSSYSGTIVSGSEFTIRDWETAGRPMKFKIEGYETIMTDHTASNPVDGPFIGGTTSATVDSITSIIIGDGVSEVRGPDLFQDISNLTSFVIGKDVTTIPFGFTKVTPNLTNITVDGANPNFYVESNILYKVSGVNNTATTHNVSVANISGTNRYLIDNQAYPALTFTRGSTYTLNINTTGHPFWIQSTNNAGAYDSSNEYNNGVTNNGATSGTITFVVPYDAPNTLYYRCQHHTGMGNTINIVSDSSVNTKQTLVQYNPASTASPNYDIDTGVEVIGQTSFNMITTLNTVTIPTSVTQIGASAFAGCSALTSVNFTPGSQLTYIRSSAFAQCAFTSITIPNKVENVYSGAFDQCSSLTTVNIDGSENWTTGINFVNEPLPIFKNNNALTNVNMKFGQKINTITNISSESPTSTPYTYLTNGATGSFFGSPTSTVINLTQATGLVTIANPNYNTTTGGAANDGSKFTIRDWEAAGYPPSFKVVGYETFGQDVAEPNIFMAHISSTDSTAHQTLKGYIDTITDVEIGDGVTTLEGTLFDSISNLTRVKIGQHVTSISMGFVYNIHTVNSIFDTIELDSNNTNFTVASNVLYKVSGANTKHTLVQYPLGSTVTNFSIPSGVVVLGEGSMAGYVGTSVTIPTSLTTIEPSALIRCTNLSTITFATGTSSLTTIGTDAFAFNTNLTTIILPDSVATIGIGAFKYSSNLANVTFKGVSGSGPSDITIGAGAFTSTSSSLQVTLYNRVSIGGQLQSSIGTSTGSFFGSPVSTTINIIKAPDGFKPANRAALDAAITDWITAVDSGITSNITAVTSSYGDINTWDVILVTDMSALFANKTTFNSNIGGWNTTLVTDMSTMFSGATAFDQDISGWTTTNVENMQDMFVGADAFNQDLSGWNVSGITGNRFMTYEYTSPNVIPAPICFPAGSIVLTDQGNIAIEKIDPKKHTIRSHKIEGITQTVAIENYVVMIHKSTFFKNVPIRDTIISANHRIVYKNKMIQARELIDENLYPENIFKIPYSGDTLYNVLLENKYDLMMVNNLPVETLDPNSLNAWLFRKMNSKISNSERKEIMDAYMQRLRPTPEFVRMTVGCK